ncbi:phosphopantetheine-binding protein [Marinobacter sp. M3C]|jgi:acyl carrier protein|uniref:phosphopantetheine-binding protein n=1 Tax=Marinobacter sp. M3C TaxID=2917715 RepID=UPI00200FE692|nr:phosphopantetheine-binding protein [Marinobacter sp. M3C]MCL1478838.1 phosphopantetheine-binding protein [Marinobacter sp.]MCL1484093.1 phosphopantetheine-binding protein [Marinobacter sp.]MCL1487429.1 phosphopantetheine-binding protein [Marinobacter sp.]UQG61151.1 phosphopantetheine-binding protein [Marinobacter sp. M3C]
MNELKIELKKLVIDALELEDITVDDIDSSEPLFLDGLGLDSIDALELGLALQKRYNIKLAADSEKTRKHFASINNLAELVASHESARGEI